MTEVPDIIRSAVDERRHRQEADSLRPAREIGATRVVRGDVRVLQPPSRERWTDPRLCLVVGADPTGEFADVVLIHSATELTTSIDGVVPSSVSGAPYALVVQTDLRGAVWTFQLGRRVGHLDERALDALSSIALGSHAPEGDRTDSELWSGSPLTGESDRRWAFKADEGDVFHSLTGDCTAVLIDGGTIWEVDPELLLTGQLEGVTDSPDVIQELEEWRSTRKTRRLMITDQVLREMVERRIPTPSRESDLAYELATLGWQLAVDISTDPSSPRASTGGRRIVTTRALRRAEQESCDAVYVLGERAPA
jgi:hypothetical protein